MPKHATTALLLAGTLALGAPSTKAAPNADCWQCANIPTYDSGGTCDRTWHQDAVDDYDTMVDMSGIMHNNAPCPCVYTHGSCGGEDLDLGVLSVAVDVSNVESVTAILEAFPRVVRLNAERNAIDVFDCRGEIVHQLDVSDELWRSLHADLAE